MWEERLGILFAIFSLDLKTTEKTEEKLAKLRIFIDNLEQLYYQTATSKGILPKVRYLAAKQWADATKWHKE